MVDFHKKRSLFGYLFPVTDFKNPNIPGDTVISKVARLMGHHEYYATKKIIIYKTFVEWTFKTLYNNKRVAAVLKISDLEDLRTSPIN